MDKNRILREAIYSSDKNGLSLILSKYHYTFPELYDHLFSAMINNNELFGMLLDYALANGFSINYVKTPIVLHDITIPYASLLNIAIGRNLLDIVKLLINNDANFDQNSADALSIACINGHVELAKLFIELGLDIQKQTLSTLYKVVHSGHNEIIKLFIFYQYPIPSDILIYVNYDSPRFLSDESRNERDRCTRETIKLLVDNGAEINVNNKFGSRVNPLNLAIRSSSANIIRFLINNGAIVNAVNSLINAVERGDTEIFDIIYNNAEWTLEILTDCFRHALKHRTYQIIDYLLKRNREIWNDKLLSDCLNLKNNVELVKILEKHNCHFR